MPGGKRLAALAGNQGAVETVGHPVAAPIGDHRRPVRQSRVVVVGLPGRRVRDILPMLAVASQHVAVRSSCSVYSGWPGWPPSCGPGPG